MRFLKMFMGYGGAKSESKKEEIRNIFTSKVENGEDYTVVAAWFVVHEKKLLKDVTTYYNYIVGYKDGDDPEIVIISTDPKLSTFEEPVLCKKSECESAVYNTKDGMFAITHPAFGKDPLKFGIIATTRMGSYVISISYLDEYNSFLEFFQNRFAK